MTTPTSAADLAVGPRLVAARWDSLWIAGDPTALEPPLVAIVGTRAADAQGLRITRAIAEALAREHVTVLSGGALGIDAAAHTGALASNGRTVVVLPSGLEHWYPQRHAPLYDSVLAQGGALVSPFPPTTPPAHWTFPRRNELLAALCDLLVVVQAPPSSGSLLTADAARRLGRRILVVPASPGDPRGGGCLKLLRAGAELCARPSDVLEALRHRDGPLQLHSERADLVREKPESPSRTRARTSAARAPAHHTPARNTPAREASAPARTSPAPTGSWTLDDDSRSVYESLAFEARHLDEIANRAALPAKRVRTALLTLVLLSLAVDRGDGTYTRTG